MRTPGEETKHIIERVAAWHGVPVKDIMGRSRLRSVVYGRHAAIAAVAEARPNLSSMQIAAVFGRDHSTILYAIKAHKLRLAHSEGE